MDHENHQSLGAHKQVSALIYQLLVPAVAAGLSEERAEALYTEICEHYGKIDGAAFPAWRKEMLQILNAR